MNISKELKKKRDAEARLNKTSPTPVYVAGPGGDGGDGDFITYQTIINNFTEVINEITHVIENQLIAGNNITLTDNLDGTFIISSEASADIMFDGGSVTSNDFTVTIDGGGA